MIPEIPPDLLHAIVHQKCVPFFGAGISVPSGLPTSIQFLEEHSIRELPFAYGTQLMEHEGQLWHAIYSTFGDRTRTPNDLHKLLVHLDAKYYITTNYDLLFERAFQDIYHDSEVRLLAVNCDQNLPCFLEAEKVLIKFHGDVDRADYLVVTSSSYRARLRCPTFVDSIVQLLLMNYVVLFLGVSLNDEDVLELLEQCNRVPGGRVPRKYLIADDLGQEKTTLLRTKYGVTTIPVCKNDLSDYLDAIRVAKEHREYTFSSLVLPPPSNTTAKEIIEELTRLKQQNRINEAVSLIEQHVLHFARGHWAFNEGTLIGWIYCTLSVYDKNEDWPTLKAFDKFVLLPLLQHAERAVATQLFRRLQDRYSNGMMVSECRFLRLDSALRREMSLTPDSAADDEEKIAYADFCTLKAIAYLAKHTFRSDPTNSSLHRAGSYLAQAKANFDGVGKRTHFKGRMHGMELFLHFAAVRAGISEYRQPNPLECAWMGANSEEVTGYGRIAGLYCVAYCCCMLAKDAKASNDAAKEQEYRKQALTRIDEALGADNMKSGRPLTRFKFQLLRSSVMDVPLTEEGIAGPGDASEVERILRENVGGNFSREKWLHLPLN
jgi:hypothetical protein